VKTIPVRRNEREVLDEYGHTITPAKMLKENNNKFEKLITGIII